MAESQNQQFQQMYKEMRKARSRFYIPLIFMLALAGAGVWASVQFFATGEVAIPLPEKAASFVSETLNLGSDRKLGPIRFGSAPEVIADPAAPATPVAAPAVPATASADFSAAAQNPEGTNGSSIKMPLPNLYDAGAATSGNVGVPASADQSDNSGADTGNTADSKSSFSYPDINLDNGNNTADILKDEAGQTNTLNTVNSLAGNNGAASSAIPDISIDVTPPAARLSPKTLSEGRPRISEPDPKWKGKEPVIPYVPLAETRGSDTATKPATGVASGDSARQKYVSQADKDLFAERDKPKTVAMSKDGGPQVAVQLSKDISSARDLRPTFGPGATDAERDGSYALEDSVVTLGFVKDLAAYLTSCYWPAGTHPNYPNKSVSTANIKNINQRYGIDLRGFNGGASNVRDYYRDRELILNYTFMPSMLEALTRLYAERFATLLAQAGSLPVVDSNGKERRLTRQQNIAMLIYYADDARALGAALQAYAEADDAAAVVAKYNSAVDEVYKTSSNSLDATAAMEAAKHTGNAQAIEAARRKLDDMEKYYRAGLESKRAAEAVVYKMMLKGASTRLDSSSLVYIACWLNRRVSDKETVVAAAASAEYIAKALASKAEAVRVAK